MRGYKVYNVAWLAPSSCGHCFVDSQVNWIQNIPEDLIFFGGKEAKVAVRHPFQTCRLLARRNLSCLNCGELAQPGDLVASCFQCSCVGEGRRGNALFSV